MYSIVIFTEIEWKDYGRDLEHNITTLSWRFSCCLFRESSRRSHKKCCGSLMEWLWKTSCLFQKHSRYVDKYFIFVYCCLTAWRPSTNLRFSWLMALLLFLLKNWRTILREGREVLVWYFSVKRGTISCSYFQYSSTALILQALIAKRKVNKEFYKSTACS